MTAPTARHFHLGDILSIATGRLVAPDHMGGVYRILNFMTGDNLYTHQLPRAAQECRSALEAQHPWVASIQPPDDFGPDPDSAMPAWFVWLTEQVALYGEQHPVLPLAATDHTRIDPLAELAMLRPDTPVIMLGPAPEPAPDDQ